MPALKVRCPACRAEYTIDESALGKKARCKKPGCGHSFRVGRTDSGLPNPAAASASVSPVGPPAPPLPAEDPPGERPRGADGIPRTWEPGDVILDLYEVTGVLGEGGMGRV